MQNLRSLFFITFLCVFGQLTDSQAQSPFTKKADSLFNEKNYAEAAQIYQELIAKHDINKGLAYLKLAYIHENQGEFSLAMYYLNQYYHLHPEEKVFDKINEIAEENGFEGYGRNDINFFGLIVRKNAIWVFLLGTGIVLYSFVVLFLKRSKGTPIPQTHKLSLTAGIILLLALINFPKIYQTGIVKKSSSVMRKQPSAGSAVVGNIGEGSKVNIIGQKDIWVKLFHNQGFAYIKESDLWIIGEE
ncbi:tetratricopeptide repeat protein [Jiulongibacter sp. NS-SX5]|uniref:tetratricopeptide repeat protein n=1 Tax=Jiulongibacter sp. NS-SX5 TaxID=3463854 RepID=UPI004058457E